MNDRNPPPPAPDLLVIGAGPAGLMAADIVSAAGRRVAIVDRMPSPGRKFLMAGVGGLNLTHSEPLERMLERYGSARMRLEPALRDFPPQALRDWASGLGQETFIGSSGRVFPRALKASPLLRAWMRRLSDQGATFHPGWRWEGTTCKGAYKFIGGDNVACEVSPSSCVLALGGASWARLGSDGVWPKLLSASGISCVDFEPANCGFQIAWSEAFRTRFNGQPLKRVALRFGSLRAQGDLVVTLAGLEGGGLYALAPPLREALKSQGSAELELDLLPGRTTTEVADRLAAQPAKQSLSNRLRKAAGLSPVAINLLRETENSPAANAEDLAQQIKSLRLRLVAPAGLERAISTAGGLSWDELDAQFMLHRHPGLFAAGEMIDWEAPTGGYLLQACMATGVAAGRGVLAYLSAKTERPSD